jgi:hypothetical protein
LPDGVAEKDLTAFGYPPPEKRDGVLGSLKEQLLTAAHLHNATVQLPVEETRKDDVLQEFHFNYTDGAIHGTVHGKVEQNADKRSSANGNAELHVELTIQERHL